MSGGVWAMAWIEKTSSTAERMPLTVSPSDGYRCFFQYINRGRGVASAHEVSGGGQQERVQNEEGEPGMHCRSRPSLRNPAAHAPHPCLERERAVVLAAEELRAQARLELPAALVVERDHVGAARAGAFEERSPIVVERRERLIDHQGMLPHLDQRGFAPELAELALARELHVSLVFRRG